MGQLLQVVNGVVTGIVGSDNGALAVFNGTLWEVLAAGEQGKVLMIDGDGNPAWSDPPRPGNWKSLL